MDKQQQLNFLSLFTGAGGLDLGLEAAGFRCIGSVEINEIAHQTIKRNRPSWQRYNAMDINSIANTITPQCLGLKKKGELDLIAGAPPCQPFSTAGQWAKAGRRGLNDSRARTLDSFLAIVARLEPKLAILENVPGFKSEGGLQLVAEVLENCGYYVSSKVVECSLYGIPQKRRRLILVASRKPSFEWELGKECTRNTWDALHNVKPQEKCYASGKWANLLPTIPEGENYLWHSSVGGGEEIFGNRTRFWSFLLKLAKDKPAWTLAASPGPATGPFHWDNRPLTPLEALRIQTFPKSWKLQGNRREQIRLIGNATPPLLGERIGRALTAHLGVASKKGTYKYGVAKAKTPLIISEHTIELPDEYLHLVGKKEKHPGAGLGPAPRNTTLSS